MRIIMAVPTCDETVADGRGEIEARLGVGQHQHHPDEGRAAVFHVPGRWRGDTGLAH